MPDLIAELKQYALMTANEMKRLQLELKTETIEPNSPLQKLKEKIDSDPDSVILAYRRAKNFPADLNALLCPVCWVRNGDSLVLYHEAEANESMYLKCNKCGFRGAFPKTTS